MAQRGDERVSLEERELSVRESDTFSEHAAPVVTSSAPRAMRPSAGVAPIALVKEVHAKVLLTTPATRLAKGVHGAIVGESLEQVNPNPSPHGPAVEARAAKNADGEHDFCGAVAHSAYRRTGRGRNESSSDFGKDQR